MPTFFYKARNESGAVLEGTVEAENELAAVRILSERNLFPFHIQVTGTAAETPRAGLLGGIRTREIADFYGQMADLLSAGVPLLRALDTLIASTANPRLREVIREVRASVADGASLTESLNKFPHLFPPLHTAMVHAGERAGFVEQVFRSLAEFVERLNELRARVIGTMIYPLLLVLGGSTVLIVALLFFVPKFEALLAAAPKPLPTQIVFGASHLVRNYGSILVLCLISLAGLLYAAATSEMGKRTLERWRLSLPLIGPALRSLAIARFCRILGTLLANGVPILQALQISKDAIGSHLLADRIAEALEGVREGKTLTPPLRKSGIFPEQILAMIAVAEEANRLDEVLVRIADTVERNTNRMVDQVIRLLEPAILVFVAAGIGTLALGLLIPIFSLASSLGQGP